MRCTGPGPGSTRRVAAVAPAVRRRSRVAWGLFLAALGLGGGGWPSGLEGQAQPAPTAVAVVGTVLDRSQDRPVPQVSIVLTWDGDLAEGAERPSHSALSDENGAFLIEGVRVGSWNLTVSRLGYQRLEQAVVVDGASPFTLAIRLAPEAVAVEGFVVTTRRNPWLQQHGFYARQMRGMGNFYTGEDLDALGLYQTTDLFLQLSGASLVSGGSPTSPFVVFRGDCPPDVVLDGLNMGHRVRIDDLVTPGEIEGLEVYRGAANPGLYSSNPCGSILIWTLGSATREGRPWSFRRLLVAGGLVLVGVLLAR